MKFLLQAVFVVSILLLSVSCNQNEHDKEWAEIFNKYNI